MGLHFVISDTACIQPSRERLLLKNHNTVTQSGEVRRTTETSRARSNDRYAETRGLRRRVQNGNSPSRDKIGRVTLKEADLDGFIIMSENAGSFAEDLSGADARATCSEDVGREDRFRSAREIASGDFFDKCGNVNARGTGMNAGCIIAVEASLRLGNGRPVAQWPVNFLH